MANPDRDNGLRPVGTIGASAWNGAVRKYQVADRSADTTNSHGHLFIGDPCKLSSGKVLAANSNDTILGVVVQIGYESSVNDGVGPYNPGDLTAMYAPLTVATGYYAWVALADNTVFEIQSASDLDLAVGAPADLNTAANTAHGSTTTGQSTCELTTASNNDVLVVEIPEYPDNDSTLANTRYHVTFVKTVFEQ